MKKVKILIVDDRSSMLELMKDILDREGYETVAVSSGDEALQQAKQAFDLLLTDIVMPGMGGMELIRAFQEASPNTASILITGHASVETARDAVDQGVYDYIVKPVDREKLCSAVAKALERKKPAK
jgi:two-component system response regulator PilR (NtrC family)